MLTAGKASRLTLDFECDPIRVFVVRSDDRQWLEFQDALLQPVVAAFFAEVILVQPEGEHASAVGGDTQLLIITLACIRRYTWISYRFNLPRLSPPKEKANRADTQFETQSCEPTVERALTFLHLL
jgi:hypothetical protein